jgi:hypothetical protein
LATRIRLNSSCRERVGEAANVGERDDRQGTQLRYETALRQADELLAQEQPQAQPPAHEMEAQRRSRRWALRRLLDTER